MSNLTENVVRHLSFRFPCAIRGRKNCIKEGISLETLKRPIVINHIPKCAGSSIREVLPSGTYLGHTPASVWIHPNLLGDSFFRAYRFCVVRNPYDRFLSAYTMLKDFDTGNRNDTKTRSEKEFFRPYADKTFEFFVLNCPASLLSIAVFRPQHEFFLLHGKVAVNKILFMEKLEQEWPEVAKEIGANPELPRVNTSKHDNYEKVYTNQMRDRIFDLYRADFELLGYKKDIVGQIL